MAKLVPLKQVLTPSFRKPRLSSITKQTVEQGDAIEDTAFKQGFEIVKILNEVVESQLFASL